MSAPVPAPTSATATAGRLNAILCDLEARHTAIPHLYVVLPAYNENEALVAIAWELEQVLKDYTFQILVVDDGSTDASMAILAQAGLPHVRVIHHEVNRGLGAALRTGLNAACQRATQDGDVVIVMDADCTHTPYLIDRLVRLIREGNDIAIASRYRYGAQVIGLSPVRELLSHGASWLFRLMLPIRNVKDYTCGFRAYRVSLLRRAMAHYGDRLITENGFSCMAELLVKLARFGALVCEAPMVLRYDRKRSTSKMRVAKTILTSLGVLARLRALRQLAH